MSVRVLVADADGAVRDTILRVLGDDGFEVVEAASADQALERLRAEPFALVITDVDLRKATGFDLVREVGIQEPDAVVVVMTGGASLERATSALRNGAYDFLVKPLDDPETIRSIVHRAIDRHALNATNRALTLDLDRSAEETDRLNARLTDLANRDGLTGLYNRRSFRESLEQELARCRRHHRPFSLLLLDVDLFRRYNDAHGHLAGDSLLRNLARLLQERARGETLVARCGGDEFVLLVPEADTEGTLRYAEILRSAIEAHPFVGCETQPGGSVSVSVGVACYPEAGRDSASLVDHASRALEDTKERGRNGVTLWAPAIVG